MGLYIGNEKIGGGLITQVNALPEANATNYAKNQLYLYENKLYFIVLDGSTYKMKKLGQDAPSLISFNIAGDSYQAESEMTWSQWVNSAYNTDGFRNEGQKIINSSFTRAVAYNNVYVSINDVIIDSGAYTLKNYGG